MAPSTFLRLSTPFLPHALPLNLKSPIFPFPHSTPRRSKPRNPPLISCRATDPSPSPPLSVDSPGTGTGTGTGTGAAAPTPGELFLERRRAADAATTVLKAAKKERRKEKEKKKKQPKKKISTAVACCYGCGAPLQIEEVDAPGYVDVETYELKKKHRQLRTILCGRCKLLAHGHMVPAVGGHGGYPGGKQFVTAEQLREKLSHLKDEKALIVKLVDIVDFNGSFLARVRDLAGKNPIILVITKIDLLPKETDLNCIGDWVVEASARKKLNGVGTTW